MDRVRRIQLESSSLCKPLILLWAMEKLFPKVEFLPFEENREFVRKLGIKTTRKWARYCKSGKRPSNIPSNPNIIYKDKGWTNWGDFLGSNICLFKKAREFVRKLELQNEKEWREYCRSGKKPDNIPNYPNEVYKDKGWINLGDFLGTGYVSHRERIYMSFEEAKEFVRKLKLKSQKEWEKYWKSEKKPDNIPLTPNIVYKDKGWINWGDFLGKGMKNVNGRRFLPFTQLRKLIRKLKLKNYKEWCEYYKMNNEKINIPHSPNVVYKDKGWINWGDFLGTGNVSKKYFVSYKECSHFAKKLGIKRQIDWQAYSKSGKKPHNIPSNPDIAYKNKGWQGYKYFLGTNK